MPPKTDDGQREQPANGHDERNAPQEIPDSEWQSRKLRAETLLAESAHSRWRSLERSVTVGLSGLTALVAVLGLIWSAYSQRMADEVNDRHRREDRLGDVAKQFLESKSEPSRLVAITNLRLLANDSSLRPQVRSILITGLSDDVRSDAARSAIADALLVTPDSQLLAALIWENRQLQKRIQGLHADASAATRRIVTRKESTTVEQFPGRLSGADTSLLRRADADLARNIDIIVRVMNSLGIIRHADISHVVLSRYAIRERFSPAPSNNVSVEIVQLPQEQFADGLTFASVSLEGSVLAGRRFRGVTFRDTKLDSALLAGVMIFNGTLTGQTSLRNFQTAGRYVVRTRDGSKLDYTFPDGPEFYFSDVRVVAFAPRLASAFSDGTTRNKCDRSSKYFAFHLSTWAIDTLAYPASGVPRDNVRLGDWEYPPLRADTASRFIAWHRRSRSKEFFGFPQIIIDGSLVNNFSDSTISHWTMQPCNRD